MEMAQQTGAVALVFLLLGVALWLARRVGWNFGNSPAPLPAPTMERLGRLPLTPQHTLHLIRIQGAEFLVATYPQGCSLVSTGLNQGLNTGLNQGLNTGVTTSQPARHVASVSG
jgi:flagellar biogenesis protein FliO